MTMIVSVNQLPPPTAFSRLPRHVKHPRVSLPVQARHDSTPQAPMSPSERSACSLLQQLVLQCSANSAASATLSPHGNHRHEREQRCRHARDTCRLSGAVDRRRCASVARAGPRHRPASRSNIYLILSYLYLSHRHRTSQFGGFCQVLPYGSRCAPARPVAVIQRSFAQCRTSL